MDFATTQQRAGADLEREVQLRREAARCSRISFRLNLAVALLVALLLVAELLGAVR